MSKATTPAAFAAGVIPAGSAAAFVASKIVGQSPNDMTIAMLIGMGLATLPSAGLTIYNAILTAKQRDEPAHIQRTISTHAVTNFFLTSAVAAMFLGLFPYARQSDAVKVALSATPLFLNHGLINSIYYALLRFEKITRKPVVELISAVFGLLGSLLFLAAEVLAFVEAKRKNDNVQMNAAGTAAIGVAGFVYSTGYGTFQGIQAVRKAREKNNSLRSSLLLNASVNGTSGDSSGSTRAAPELS